MTVAPEGANNNNPVIHGRDVVRYPRARCRVNRPRLHSLAPTRPAAHEVQGITEDGLIDFAPELRRAALESLRNGTMSFPC